MWIVIRTASLRPLTIPPQVCTVWCTKLWKRFHAIMEVFYCFTVAISLPGDASCIKLQWRQKVGSCNAHAKQGGCRVRQQLELGVRLWLFGPHWSSCQKYRWCNVRCFTSTCKNKEFQHFCQHWHFTWQNWAKLFRRDVLTLHRWKLP